MTVGGLFYTEWAGRVSWIRWDLSKDLEEAREVTMQIDVGKAFQAQGAARPGCSQQERVCL